MTETAQFGNQTALAHSASPQSKELVRMLIEENQGYDDFVWRPRTDNRLDTARIQVGLPKSSIRITNQGVVDSKGRRVEVYEGGMKLESRFRNDEDYLEDLDNADMERYEEIEDHMSVLGMDFWKYLFMGSGLGGEILGLQNRFNERNIAKAASARNIVNAMASYKTKAGFPDRLANTATSDTKEFYDMWVIKHHATKFYCHYPPKFGATPKHVDRGLQEVTEAGRTFDAQTDKIRWKFGITIKKWTSIVRVCNIKLAHVRDNPLTEGGPNLIKLGIAAKKRVAKGAGKICIYTSSNVAEHLDYQMTTIGQNAGQAIKGVEGQDVDTFRKLPIREVDALTVGPSVNWTAA